MNSHEQDNPMKVILLPHEQLEQYLSLYKEESRHILSAQYSNMQLQAELKPFAYTYTCEDLDYITATQISLYLSQLTYVLIGTVIKNGDHPNAPSSLFPVFMDKMHAGRLFFLEINQRMREPIWKTEPITAQLTLTKLRKTPTAYFGFLQFAINTRKCSGTMKIGMER
jgi:hypothetical protein